MHSSRLLLVPFLLIALGCSEREMGWPRPDFAPNVEYGPRIADVTADGFRVVWRTIAPVRGALHVRIEGDVEWRVVPGGTAPGRDHQITVAPIRTDRAHEYRLLHDGQPVTPAYRLRPRSDGQTTFAVLGDSGTGGEVQYAITRQMAAHDPEFVLHTGDAAYDFGTRREMLRRFFVPYARSLATRPWYVAWGNHDVMTDGGEPLRRMLAMPGSHYYSIDRGTTRFYILDTNVDFRRGSAQHDWFVADLKSSPDRRRIAVFHHAPYNGSPYTRTFRKITADVREHLCPLFDQYGFELVFNGHVHGYERAEPAGRKPIYITTGGGGKRLNKPGAAEFTKKHAAVWHFCIVTMTRDGFVVRAINDRGEEFDRRSTRRGP
ncbi:MAG: metallophosphoesterase family protein [Planctomycetota bacterium]|jgi:3',5'-cyclic AMP phosphodiesterase CpdA